MQLHVQDTGQDGSKLDSVDSTPVHRHVQRAHEAWVGLWGNTGINPRDLLLEACHGRSYEMMLTACSCRLHKRPGLHVS